MADINNPIKYSDLITPDDSIEKLITQLDEVSNAYMNFANNVKSQASSLAQSLQGVSGATESGRKAIRDSASDAARLEKAYQGVDQALSANAKKIAELNAIKAEQNRINKLQVQIAKSEEGSYNRLSAEYSLLKIQINALSAEERKNNAEAKAMVQRSAELYEEMKRLQEETGKHQLNVGNYADAAKGLRMELRELTQQLTAMKLAGDTNSEEYRQMSARAAELTDAMKDTKTAIQGLASDTSSLDSVMSGMTAASGGMTAMLGAMTLFGSESEDVAVAQKKLQAAMSITMGLTQVQNALQKQSALMLGISKVQTLALAKAEAYERLIKMQGTNATIRATIAQKAFNLVAKANPYVLLATALITVVGALALFAKGTESASEKQERLNKAENDYIDYLERIEHIEKITSETRIKNLTNELNVAKARNASVEEIRSIEDKIAAEEKKQYEQRKAHYAYILQNIEAYKQAIREANDTLLDLQKRAEKTPDAKITLNIDGRRSKMKISEAITAMQNWIDTKDRKLQIAMSIKQEGKDKQSEAEQRAAERAREDAERYKEARKNEIQATRDAEKAKLDLIKDGYQKQRQELINNAKNTIADIRRRLVEEKNLTAAARSAMNQQIIAVQKKLYADLQALAKQQQQAELDTIRETEAIRIAAMRDSREKEKAELLASYETQEDELRNKMMDEQKYSLSQRTEFSKQLVLLQEQKNRELGEVDAKWNAIQQQTAVDETQMRLEALREGSQQELDLRLQLIEQSRQAEIAANRAAVEEMRVDEQAINDRYDKLALRERAKFAKDEINQWADMMQSEIDLSLQTSRKKEQMGLELEAQRLKKIIDLIESGAMEASSEELTTYRNQYEKAIRDAESLQKLGTKISDGDALKKGLENVANYTLEILATVTEARVKMAEAAVAAADKEVEAAKKALDTEREAAANGYANNQEMAQKELDMAKENQRKAVAQQKKAQKQQQAVDTLMQISSLVTASASMWRDLGFPWALVGIATMWASFAASKIMAAKLAKQNTEEYGEGTVELLEGGSHASGNDIDLGVKKDGTRRRAEGGEYFAVINKRSSRRYRRQIPDVINSLNDGTFGRKYLNAYDAEHNNGVGLNVALSKPTDVSVLEGEVRKIREQGETRTYIDANGNLITKYKNVTRRTKQ